MKSKAELRIAARVRSDLPILSAACGVTRSGEDDVAIIDMMLQIIDTVSVCQGLLDISTSFKTHTSFSSKFFTEARNDDTNNGL